MKYSHTIIFKSGDKYLSLPQVNILTKLGFSGIIEVKGEHTYCFPSEDSVIIELNLLDVMELSKMFKVEILKPYIIISTY